MVLGEGSMGYWEACVDWSALYVAEGLTDFKKEEFYICQFFFTYVCKLFKNDWIDFNTALDLAL